MLGILMSWVIFFIVEEFYDEDIEMRYGCEMEILQRWKWNIILFFVFVKGEYM